MKMWPMSYPPQVLLLDMHWLHLGFFLSHWQCIGMGARAGAEGGGSKTYLSLALSARPTATSRLCLREHAWGFRREKAGVRGVVASRRDPPGKLGREWSLKGAAAMCS